MKEAKESLGNEVLVRSTNLKDLLPVGFNLQITAQQAATEQQGLVQDRIISFSQATERVVEMEARRPEVDPEEAIHALTKLLDAGYALGLYKIDPIEQYRIDQGLTAKRESLYRELYKKLSAKKGLELFNRLSGRNYQDIDQLNRDCPHVMQTELALFSLVNTIPKSFIEFGKPRTEMDALLVESDEFSVPMIIGASVEGLLCTADSEDPNVIASIDAYGQLGITGAPGPVETVFFEDSTAKIVTELISLTISNYRMHERVINCAPNALVDGFSQADKWILRQLMGERFNSGIPLGQLISGLTPDQRQKFAEAKDKFDHQIAQVRVIDLNQGKELRMDDIVKILGVLDSIPKVLLSEQPPFQGFFVPYGPGVMFLDGEGQPMQFVPYRPFYLRNALQGLYYETVDVGKNNLTMTLIFNDLARQAAAVIARDYEKGRDTLSALEEIKIDTQLVCGIDLDILPRMDIEEVIHEADARHQMGAVTMLEPRLKIGLEEAKQFFETLKLLPKELLKGVKTIRKSSRKKLTLEQLLTGAEEVASFDKIRKAITLYEEPMLPYVAFSPELRVLRSFVIIHETAHSFWNSIPIELRKQWQGISWDEGGVKKDELSGFLTLYSHVANPEEDFCDHFASYVLHADEFRARIRDNISLDSKYNFIKQFLANRLGRMLEFPQISPFSLEKIHGAVNQQLQKFTEEQALIMMERREEEEELSARKAIESVSPSTDRDQAVDVIKPAENAEIESSSDSADEQQFKQDLLDFKRESINTIIDYIAGELDEKRAISISQRIYDLVFDSEIEEAKRLARKYIEDRDDYREFVEELEQMHEDLENGNIGIKRRKIL